MSNEPAEGNRTTDAGTAEDELLGMSEAAELLGVSPRDLERLRQNGEIPAVSERAGWGRRQWHYSRAALETYRAERQKAAAKHRPSTFSELMGELTAEMPPPPEDFADVIVEAPPAVRMANAILSQAIAMGASDIYIELTLRSVILRVRIDGTLHELMPLPRHLQKPLINRYKVMADLPEDTAALPREGVIRVKHNGSDYNLHVTVLPTRLGETVSIGIVHIQRAVHGLSSLGMEPKVQSYFEETLAFTPGLLLVAGRAGHGTTTTLRTTLHKINSVEKKILEIGAPWDADIPGITHLTPDPSRGRTVPELVRAALAQRADVIALGDINDAETARCALDAAEHGVLVLAAMHAPEGAVSAIERLRDWDIPPQRLARLVGGVLAQRLVRRLCPECRNSYQIPVSQIDIAPRLWERYLDRERPDLVTLYRAVGCEACDGSGYRGREGLFQFLTVGERTREFLRGEGPPRLWLDGEWTLEAAATGDGMLPLRVGAAAKLLNGVTDTPSLERAGLRGVVREPYLAL